MAPHINEQLYMCVRPSLCQAVHPPVAPGDQMKLMATLMCLCRPFTPLDNTMTDQTLTLVLDHMPEYRAVYFFLSFHNCRDFLSLFKVNLTMYLNRFPSWLRNKKKHLSYSRGEERFISKNAWLIIDAVSSR